MATGDIFVELGGNNASITLQPLGTAAIMVTSLANTVGVGSEPPVEITDGANNASFAKSGTQASSMQSSKIFGNNTNYIFVPAGGAGTYNCITGVEVA